MSSAVVLLPLTDTVRVANALAAADTPRLCIADCYVEAVESWDARSWGWQTEFQDRDKLDIVGVYPNYATAHAAWRGKAQQTVDNAQMRYFIVHLHRLLDPEATAPNQA